MLTRKELYRSSDPSFWHGLIVASFLFVAFAFAFSGHAEAHSWRHRHHSTHHGRHAHYQMHHNRHFYRLRSHHRYRRTHRHFMGRYRVPPNAYRYEALAAAGSSRILATAERYLGDRNPTGFRGPYCKAFVNMIARKTGHFYNVSKRAIDALYMGIRVRVPRPGDVAVMAHHVSFFAGWGGRGFIAVGGNQGHHRVTVSSYPLGRVIAFVRLR